jgi:hypothetical protein
MSFDASLKIALPLFPVDAKSIPSQAQVESSVRQLADQALVGDEDAIEILLNLSAGKSDSTVSQTASRALLDLYGDPRLPPAARHAIGAQASRLFETQQSTSASRSGSKARQGDQVVRISTPLLYLAGQYAHEKNYTALEKSIQATVLSRTPFSQLGPSAQEPDLLTLGRFSRTEEMQAATSGLKSLAIHTTCLELDPPSGASSFTSQLNALREKVDSAHKPMGAFVNVGNHWVTLLLVPGPGQPAKLHAMVIDSHLQRNESRGSPALVKAVRTYLGARAGDIELLGGAMQTHAPNACGPLSVLMVKHVDRLLNTQSPSSFQSLVQEMQKQIGSWQSFPPDSQKAVVIAERARMLETIAPTQ